MVARQGRRDMIHHIVLRQKKVSLQNRWATSEDWQEPVELWVRPQDIKRFMPTIKVLFDTPSIARILKAQMILMGL